LGGSIEDVLGAGHRRLGRTQQRFDPKNCAGPCIEDRLVGHPQSIDRLSEPDLEAGPIGGARLGPSDRKCLAAQTGERMRTGSVLDELAERLVVEGGLDPLP
jgi:hypothetical protein